MNRPFRPRIVAVLLLLTVSTAAARYRLGPSGPEPADDNRPAKNDFKGAPNESDEPSLRTGDDAPRARGDRSDAVRRSEDRTLDSLAETFSIERRKLDYLRSLRHGYRNLVYGLLVAKDAQAELGRVLERRVAGQSWNAVADEFFVNWEELDRAAKALLEPLQKSIPRPLIEERPEVRGKNER